MNKTEQNFYVIAISIYVIRMVLFLIYQHKLRKKINISPFSQFIIFIIFMILPYFIVGIIASNDKDQYRGLYYFFHIYSADFWFIISLAMIFLYKYLKNKK